MINIERIEDNKYKLIITETDGTVIEKKIDWKELTKIFCQVAKEVCKQVRKGE